MRNVLIVIVVALAAFYVWASDLPRRVAWRFAPPAVESDDWVVRNSCVRQLQRARWSWRAYREILGELKNPRYLVVPMREYAHRVSAPPTDRVLVGLRHDLDGSLCRAERMAEIEQAMGIRATYFVRHTDPYFAWGWPEPQRREAVVPRYRRIAAMGHEIGLHLDALSMAFEHGVDPARLLAADLAWLRLQGLDVVGAAAHGSPMSHLAGFENYEIFAGLTTRTTLAYQGRVVPLGAVAPRDVGIVYETYHVAGDDYLSEAGGSWDGVDPIARLRAAKPGRRVQVLIHPVWWGTEETRRDQY